jgi:hypothetical protein
LIAGLSINELAIYGCIGDASTKYGNILHAHGGSGILFNKHVFNKLQKFLFHTNFSIKHYLHSDVSLAMNIYEYNLKHLEQLSYTKIENMLSPHENINSIDFKKCVTFHTKDQISFNDIIKNL